MFSGVAEGGDPGTAHLYNRRYPRGDEPCDVLQAILGFREAVEGSGVRAAATVA